MSLISVFLAWIQTQGQGVDVFLDRLVVLERWFYCASWWIWGFALAVLIGLWFISRESGFSGLFGCVIAVIAVILLFLPLTSWITLRFATGMANAYGPAGIVSDGFWLNLVLFVLFIFSGG